MLAKANYVCQSCEKSFYIREGTRRVRCNCGFTDDSPSTQELYSDAIFKATTEQRREPKESLICRHRGPAIEELDCECQGKPKIHSCAVHGKCVVRKLPRMDQDKIKDCQICLDCDDRSIYQPNKIGFAVQVFNKVGGMETWLRSLFMNVHEHTTGIYVNSSGFADIDCTASSDPDALCQLAKSSKIVLCWGFVDGLRAAFEANPNCRFVAVHHGSLASSWANDIFKQQLEILGDGIAVNQDVAWHYGVQYLPNPVIDHGVRRDPRTEGPRRILWNHRWSPEKRPELVLEIAKHLPSGYEMRVSAPKHATLPPNCTNIGQNIDNTTLLADSDVFLGTASQEAFGYSLAEAVLARVPIVCGPYGIGTEVASKIVESDDPKVWATAIIETDDRFCESAAQWLDAHHGRTAIDTWKRYLEIVSGVVHTGYESSCSVQPSIYDRPGTELAAMLGQFGISEKISCSCKSVKFKMDRWGIAGCEEPKNRQWIIDQLQANAAKYSWSEAIYASAYIVLHPSQWLTALRLNPVSIAQSLLDEAIRRTKAKL